MVTVISGDAVARHTVDKYSFKVLPMGSTTDEPAGTPKSALVKEQVQSEPPARVDNSIDSSGISQSSKDSLIESLLKKTDEMSSNFIKLQMKLETKEEEYKLEVQKVKEASFNEGVEAGKAQAVKENEFNRSSGLEQFSSSIATLENSAKEYNSALEGIKNELITAALDISKEVVNVELGSNATSIAKVLSSELIKELQSASKVTLKVNPKDHGAISEHVGSLAHVEVMSDSAVSEGGVVAISDAGNIDAQISKRFERVKRAALSE